MAQELIVKHFIHSNERGFVLVTALIMLSLLTLMSLAMFYASRSATQTSATAQNTTEAYYYAETAIHYVSWALANDAEFDSFSYSGAYQAGSFVEPKVPLTAPSVGDFTELRTYLWDPGPTVISKTDPLGSSGQLMYFDNSPLNQRTICFQDAAKFPNCIDVKVAPTSRVKPVMEKISVKLPRYIKLEISSTGVVSPSLPSLPHQNPPVVGEDIPLNGAIIWLTATAAVPTGSPPSYIPDSDKDIEIFPLDPANAYGGISPSTCDGSTCPCTALVPADPNYTDYSHAQACDAKTGQWLSTYGVAAYAIGYVNGKPSKLLRAVIM